MTQRRPPRSNSAERRSQKAKGTRRRPPRSICAKGGSRKDKYARTRPPKKNSADEEASAQQQCQEDELPKATMPKGGLKRAKLGKRCWCRKKAAIHAFSINAFSRPPARLLNSYKMPRQDLDPENAQPQALRAASRRGNPLEDVASPAAPWGEPVGPDRRFRLPLKPLRPERRQICPFVSTILHLISLSSRSLVPNCGPASGMSLSGQGNTTMLAALRSNPNPLTFYYSYVARAASLKPVPRSGLSSEGIYLKRVLGFSPIRQYQVCADPAGLSVVAAVD